MSQIEILVIGRHPEILETVVRIINKNPDWKGTGALKDEEALQYFAGNPVRIVLFSSGISEETEKELRRKLNDLNPEITIIQHYGGGSGLLYNEVLMALEGRI